MGFPVRLIVLAVTAMAVAAPLAACHGGSGASTPASVRSEPPVTVAAATPVVVLQPWGEMQDAGALLALEDVLDRRYGHRVTLQNPVVRSGVWEASRSFPADGFALGRHGGPDDPADDAAAGEVRDLTDLYDELGLAKVWPGGLFDALATDGRLYQLPLDVDRTNLLWSSRPVLRSAGLDPDVTYTSVEEWIAALRAVRAAGEEPLALGTTTEQATLLENLLVADLGAEGCRGLWDGSTDWSGPGVTRALEQFRTITGIADLPREKDAGADAGAVVDDKAAFAVADDSLAALATMVDGTVRGMVGTEVDVRRQVMPGTAGTFVFAADTYAWDARSTHEDGARAWFETVSSVEGQTAVTTRRGGIPVRTDVDPVPFDDDTRAELADWREDALVASAAGYTATPAAGAFTKAAGRLARGLLMPQELQSRMTEAVAR